MIRKVILQVIKQSFLRINYAFWGGLCCLLTYLVFIGLSKRVPVALMADIMQITILVFINVVKMVKRKRNVKRDFGQKPDARNLVIKLPAGLFIVTYLIVCYSCLTNKS